MGKKFSVVVVLAVCILFSMAAVARSQTAGKQAPPAKPPMEKASQGKQVLGEVVKVDPKERVVTLKTKAGEKKFTVAGDAMIAGYGSVADMKPGDKVAVLYEEKDGKATAKMIANHAAMKKGAPQPGTAPAHGAPSTKPAK